jgi:hypothetical protein
LLLFIIWLSHWVQLFEHYAFLRADEIQGGRNLLILKTNGPVVFRQKPYSA